MWPSCVFNPLYSDIQWNQELSEVYYLVKGVVSSHYEFPVESSEVCKRRLVNKQHHEKDKTCRRPPK